MMQKLFYTHPLRLLGLALVAAFIIFNPIGSSLAADPPVASPGASSDTKDDPAASDKAEPSDAPDPAEPEPSNPPANSDSENPTFPDLIITAINPGYKIDGVSDVEEIIELTNLSGGPFPLDSISLHYTNGSGKTITLLEFPAGSIMTGEKLYLTYAKSPNSDLADLTYSSSLALTAGPLELFRDEALLDSVCWTGKSGCKKAFKTASRTSLIRDLSTGDFMHTTDYDPELAAETPRLILPAPEQPDDGLGEEDESPDDPEPVIPPRCSALSFSEILTYYTTDKSEQFVELYNSSDENVNLAGCQLRYKKKLYPLSGVVAAQDYYAFMPPVALTKNPTESNTLELIDSDGSTADQLTYPHGQKKSTSYAKFLDITGAITWAITYSISPGLENTYQEFRSCPSGKVVNPETGNCINPPSTSVLVECPAGKYRNPLTGRCKAIEVAKTCAEGYERNPETNRCRKIKSENNGADYPVTTATTSGTPATVPLAIVGAISLISLIYIVLQFRHEIARASRKICQRLNRFLKDLIAGKIGRDRNK